LKDVKRRKYRFYLAIGGYIPALKGFTYASVLSTLLGFDLLGALSTSLFSTWRFLHIIYENYEHLIIQPSNNFHLVKAKLGQAITMTSMLEE
jgi:hypothetical protein